MIGDGDGENLIPEHEPLYTVGRNELLLRAISACLRRNKRKIYFVPTNDIPNVLCYIFFKTLYILLIILK